MVEKIEFPIKTEGVIFLLIKNGECLVETRIKAGSAFYGHNRFPGGQIEENELPGQATFREAFEELGIVCKKITYLGSFEDMTLSKYFIKLHAFLIKDFVGEVKQSETERRKSLLLWSRTEDVGNCISLASSKLVLNLAKELI